MIEVPPVVRRRVSFLFKMGFGLIKESEGPKSTD